MIRIAYAIAVALMAYVTASGATNAAPIAPLPAEATTNANDVNHPLSPERSAVQAFINSRGKGNTIVDVRSPAISNSVAR